MRLIDAHELIKNKFKNPISYAAFCNLVGRQPTVDAVPVVRCADCIRFRPDDDVWGRCTVMPYRMRKNDYCSYGVIDDMRKDGEQA